MTNREIRILLEMIEPSDNPKYNGGSVSYQTAKEWADELIELRKQSKSFNIHKTSTIYNIILFFWNLLALGTFIYLIGWQGWNHWWMLLGVSLTKSFDRSKK